MRIFTTFLISAFGLLSFTCKNPNALGTEYQSVDSIWHQINDALDEPDSIAFRFIIKYLYEAKSKSDREVQWLTAKLTNSNNSKSNHLLSASLLLEGWHLLDQNLMEEAIIKFNAINSDQIDLKLSGLQAQAFYYYVNNQNDSALNLYLKSYYIAKTEQNNPWIIQSANNVGTLYFDQNQFGLASKYFSEAMTLSQAAKVEIPMLLNNIITCALVGSDGHEAYQLYQKFSPKFKPSSEYEKAIYDLNLIHIFWKKQEYDSFKIHLDKINVDSLGPSIIAMKDKNELFYMALKRDFKGFSQTFEKYKLQIRENPDMHLLNWAPLIEFAAEKGYLGFTIPELKYFYTLKSDNQRFHKTLSTLIYQLVKDPNEKIFWKSKSLEDELKLKEFESSSFQNELRNQLKIHELTSENDIMKQNYLIQSTRNKWILTLFIGTLMVLLLALFSFLLYKKNKQIAIQKLQLEIQNNRSLYELSLNKKQFAERLINANNSVNDKLHKISQKLKSSHVGKDPEIIQIRREINSITHLNTHLDDEMNQIKSIDDVHYLSHYLNCIKDFNQTEMQLLFYFINQHKVKEIAVLTSLSEQHIRNTKSKILKHIQQEMGRSISFEELNKLHKQ
jgi:hypothetical protein